MAEDHVRRDLLLKTTMEILRDTGTKLPPGQVLEELRRRVTLTPYELSLDKSGVARYDRAVGFDTGYAATIGWTSKIGGWSINDAGIEASRPSRAPMSCGRRYNRRYREVDQRRKQAQQALSEVQQFVATALQMGRRARGPPTMISPNWRTYRSGSRNFLAGSKVKLPNAYRVLNADGSIPVEGMLHASLSGTDLRHRLASEGIEFDADGRASQEQRLTADALKELLPNAYRSRSPSTRRAWMVRGTSVDGFKSSPSGSARGSSR